MSSNTASATGLINIKEHRAAIERLFDSVAAATDAEITRLGGTPHMRTVVIAEQTLRVCMEVVLNRSIPYGDWLIGELAVRLAAICLTAAPMDRQDAAAAEVAGNLAGCLAAKVRRGYVIRTVWEADDDTPPPVQP